jgi:hypothetical protein
MHATSTPSCTHNIQEPLLSCAGMDVACCSPAVLPVQRCWQSSGAGIRCLLLAPAHHQPASCICTTYQTNNSQLQNHGSTAQHCRPTLLTSCRTPGGSSCTCKKSGSLGAVAKAATAAPAADSLRTYRSREGERGLPSCPFRPFTDTYAMPCVCCCCCNSCCPASCCCHCCGCCCSGGD